jgi:membrane associated rhomboid family serine protease
VLPLKDNVPTRHFPIVTVALIAANVLVWIAYENMGTGREFQSAVLEASYFPCEVEGSCSNVGFGWPVNTITSMFMHASWAHLLGNMLFLWIFGNNVEDTLGRVRFLLFYVLGGLAATALQSFVTLAFATPGDAEIPNLGASGAISAVLGAYFVLVRHSSVLTFIPPFFIFPVPAVVFLGVYFVYQLVIGGYSFMRPEAGGGVAYFAHIGGIGFGLLTANAFAAGRPRPLRPTY